MNIPEWTKVKRIGNSYPSKLSIFMPFIGHIIIFQDPVLKFISNTSEFFGTKPAIHPNMQSLFFIYYGFIFFGIGSFLYYIFCPSIINAYEDKNTFIEKSLDKITSIDIKVLLHDIEKESSNTDAQAQAKEHMSAICSGIIGSDSESVRIFALSCYFDVKNQKYQLVRIASQFSFLFGIILFIIPSFFSFIRISKILLFG